MFEKMLPDHKHRRSFRWRALPSSSRADTATMSVDEATRARAEELKTKGRPHPSLDPPPQLTVGRLQATMPTALATLPPPWQPTTRHLRSCRTPST